MKYLSIFLMCWALLGCSEPNIPAAGSCSELFDGMLFNDLDGREARLPCGGHKVLLVNFWATWCGPCKQELPQLVEIAREYAGQGVKVVGISLDAALPGALKSAVAGFGLTYPVLVGGAEKIFQRTGIDGIPATLIIAGDGRIDKVLVGYHSKEEMLAPVKELLKQIKGNPTP
jgi:thiol-disulfide isomerase/thioredoxin